MADLYKTLVNNELQILAEENTCTINDMADSQQRFKNINLPQRATEYDIHI